MPQNDDYRQIREGAALAEPMRRGLLAVSGTDRASYLQGLLTNDIQALAAGAGCYAAWLTPQGRMTTDMHVLEAGDMILLDVPLATTASVLERLDQLIFSEDVTLGDLSGEIAHVGLHGPLAPGVIERTLTGADGLTDWPQYRNIRAARGSAPIVVARMDQLGVPGFVLYVGRDVEEELRRALEEQGGRAVGPEAVVAARIEAGYPLFGADLTDDIIPLEAGIEGRAISFDKGCYVGQEVVIRVLHRGHGRVARKLVGIVFEGQEAVPAATPINVGGREVGFVTSSAVSPARGSIALGYVHRDFLEAGSPVEAEWTGRISRGAVSALPFPAVN
jgi:folate-binding protein YgfZ